MAQPAAWRLLLVALLLFSTCVVRSQTTDSSDVDEDSTPMSNEHARRPTETLSAAQQLRKLAEKRLLETRKKFLGLLAPVKKIKARLNQLYAVRTRIINFQQNVLSQHIAEPSGILDSTLWLARRKVEHRIKNLVWILEKTYHYGKTLGVRLMKRRREYYEARSRAACDDHPCINPYLKCIRSLKFTDFPYRKCISGEALEILKGAKSMGFSKKCKIDSCSSEETKTLCVGLNADGSPICANPCIHSNRLGEEVCRDTSRVRNEQLYCVPTHSVFESYFQCVNRPPNTREDGVVFDMKRNDVVPGIIANVNYRKNSRKSA